MKNYIKNSSKFLLFAGFILLSFEVFSASEATKKLIHEVLAKYGISAGGKEVCDTGRDTDYDPQTGIVKCKNNSPGDSNNCWDASSRLCKECPSGTIVSSSDHITCRQIVCPEGYELKEIINNECPEGFEIKWFDETCDADTYIFNESMATKNYTTQLINCKNIKIK